MISIVIVNFNTRELLKQCLQSIASYCAAAQVIVVDNGSRDESAAMVRFEFPEVTLVESEQNLGFAGGNNLGLAHCTGDIVVLFNSDATLEDDSLTRCADWMRDHPRVGALSPRLMGVDGKPQRCLYRFPSIRGKLLEMIRRPVDSPPEEGDGWLAGTALLLRKEALDQVGGRLDDRFFMYWEDADLSARLRKAGWEVTMLADPYVRHYGGASGGGVDLKRRGDLHAWFVYGKHRWFAKNRPTHEAVLLWLLDFIEIPRHFLRGCVRPSYRQDRERALVQANVLFRLLVGMAPPPPGNRIKRQIPQDMALKVS